MKIYLGWYGPINTEKASLIVTTGRPERITIKYNGPALIFEHVYKNAKGSIAAMRGDMETAAKNELSMNDLRTETWKEILTAKEPPYDVTAQARAIAKEAQEAREAEVIRQLKKHGEYDRYMQERQRDQRDGRALLNEGAKSLYARILPGIHDAGYITRHYGGEWPNPTYRLINTATGDWDDDGPYSTNKGLFSLYDLAGIFGDPCAEDLTRRFVNPETGEVIGMVKETAPA